MVEERTHWETWQEGYRQGRKESVENAVKTRAAILAENAAMLAEKDPGGMNVMLWEERNRLAAAMDRLIEAAKGAGS